MSEAMVTGRMSAAKKKAGNKVLGGLGSNASQAINQLYDYLIEHQSLPFIDPNEARSNKPTREEARAFVASIPVPNRFSEMSDEEIKEERLSYLLSR